MAPSTPNTPHGGGTPPKLTHLSLNPRHTSPGRRTTVTFFLSSAARVTFRLRRKERGVRVGGACVRRSARHRRARTCQRLVTVNGAPKAFAGRTGLNRFIWTPPRALIPATYVLSAKPKGGRAVTVTVAIG